jgi:pyrimidine operon attenuation protein/uracil phosphoribosyltransferase
MSETKTLILNNSQIYQKINRISYQIVEDNHTEKEIVIVGIANNGYIFAAKLADQIKQIASIKITLVELTINKENPINNVSRMDIHPEALNNKVIILVDDVLNTGKALIYGVKYLLDFPIKKMSTVVLVDRNYKKYPIGTHYVGLSLSTTLQNHIYLEFNNNEFTAFLK